MGQIGNACEQMTAAIEKAKIGDIVLSSKAVAALESTKWVDSWRAIMEDIIVEQHSQQSSAFRKKRNSRSILDFKCLKNLEILGRIPNLPSIWRFSDDLPLGVK